MTQNAKDIVQYGSAVSLIASAIVIAFISLIVTMDIGSGALVYIGEAISGALAIFGVGVYFHTKMNDFQAKVNDTLNELKNKEVSNED